MALVSQAARFVAVNTPLGEDVLLFHCMSGNERLSSLFEYELDLLSETPDIALNAILGQNITVRLLLPSVKHRYVNGFVSRFTQHGAEGQFYSYQASLRPWMWFLTRTSDCRIFQNMSVPDIIKNIFRGYGFSDFEERLSGVYEAKEYCVQYRETAFNFVSWLMEREGIYYYFKHENGKPVYFRFYDPRVLRTYLPACNADEMQMFFGPVEKYFAESGVSGELLCFYPNTQTAGAKEKNN